MRTAACLSLLTLLALSQAACRDSRVHVLELRVSRLERQLADRDQQLEQVRADLDDAEAEIGGLGDAVEELGSYVDEFGSRDWRGVAIDVQSALDEVADAVDAVGDAVDQAVDTAAEPTSASSRAVRAHRDSRSRGVDGRHGQQNSRVLLYSQCRARMGSIRAARRAGRKPAAAQTMAGRTTEPTRAGGSYGLMP